MYRACLAAGVSLNQQYLHRYLPAPFRPVWQHGHGLLVIAHEICHDLSLQVGVQLSEAIHDPPQQSFVGYRVLGVHPGQVSHVMSNPHPGQARCSGSTQTPLWFVAIKHMLGVYGHGLLSVRWMMGLWNGL
jgi:hypothetical protein